MERHKVEKPGETERREGMITADEARALRDKSINSSREVESMAEALRVEQWDRWANENFERFLKLAEENIRDAAKDGKTIAELGFVSDGSQTDFEQKKRLAAKIAEVLEAKEIGFTVKSVVKGSEDNPTHTWIVEW